eukprot:scaffold2984_cov452-Prasinococcus_capsulatus_cf.AAC.9
MLSVAAVVMLSDWPGQPHVRYNVSQSHREAGRAGTCEREDGEKSTHTRRGGRELRRRSSLLHVTAGSMSYARGVGFGAWQLSPGRPACSGKAAAVGSEILGSYWVNACDLGGRLGGLPRILQVIIQGNHLGYSWLSAATCKENTSAVPKP